MNKPFVPNSRDLLSMIDSATARFDADREQAHLRREAKEEARMARVMEAEAAARRRRYWAIA